MIDFSNWAQCNNGHLFHRKSNGFDLLVHGADHQPIGVEWRVLGVYGVETRGLGTTVHEAQEMAERNAAGWRAFFLANGEYPPPFTTGVLGPALPVNAGS